MIDTDKYEGHTPGPWQFDGIECVSGCGPHPTEEPVLATLHVNEEFMLTEENMLANGKLIADAPLLLEEVKRLRERLIRAYDWAENAVNGNDSAMMDYTEYVCGGEGE